MIPLVTKAVQEGFRQDRRRYDIYTQRLGSFLVLILLWLYNQCSPGLQTAECTSAVKLTVPVRIYHECKVLFTNRSSEVVKKSHGK